MPCAYSARVSSSSPTMPETETPTAKHALAALLTKLANRGFDLEQPLIEGDEESAAVVWGRHKGVPTPRVLLLALTPEHWDKARPEHVQSRAWALTPTETAEDAYPVFAIATDGEHERTFDIASHPPHEIDQLPTLAEIGEYKRLKADPTYRWSMRQYERLMNGFNSFHEQVYQTVKDRVNGKNYIILEVAKFLFLESFRLHHPNIEFTHENRKHRFAEVFDADYVRANGKAAVAAIQAAFDQFKGHDDYVVTDDKGEPHPIFDKNVHLQIEQPRNYETLLDLIQNLGPVTDNRGLEIKARGTLADMAADALGRAFDVFLRGNFDSKGGLGIYLTPAPVKQSMLDIAFHDILAETPELLAAYDGKKPVFRYCDPACGTYGFGVVAVGRLQRALGELNLDDVKRKKLFEDHLTYSFCGADSAPVMVTLARVNMALLGAPKARIFYVQNSLTTDQLEPGSFDLICTNPPFGTPKFKKGQADARRRYEEEMGEILKRFRTDLEPDGDKTAYTFEPGLGWFPIGKKEVYRYTPTVTGKAMGASPDKKGRWTPISPTSIDPAVLFIDRCLELLKPGGRLFIILPDGVLCNSGERYVREYIMGKKDPVTGEFHGGKAIVKAVVSLPADAFKLSGTGAKTSFLYLQKRHARPKDPQHFADEAQKDVFMGVADHLGYEVKNNVEDYSKGVPNDLAAITGSYIRGE